MGRAGKPGKRRAHGEGTIYKRPSDGRWVCEITLGRKPSGTRQIIRFASLKRAEVVEWRTARNAERQKGTLLAPSRQTVGQYLTSWLEDTQTVDVSERTYESREGVCRVHIIDKLGHIPLDALTPQDVQRFLAGLRKSGLTRTVTLAYDTLRLALGLAFQWGLVVRNVVDLVKRPKVPEKEIVFLGPRTVLDFLDAAKGDRFEALYVFALTMGIREGELLGLTWDDLDLDAGTLRIARTLQRKKGAFYTSDPKSERSKRTAVMPERARVAIGEHRERQRAERATLGAEWDPRGLVFSTIEGTPVYKSNLTRRSFKPILKKANLPDIPLHSLRHSYAVYLLVNGVDMRTLQDLLGHATLAITMKTYMHVLPGVGRMAAAKIDELFAGDPTALLPHAPS